MRNSGIVLLIGVALFIYGVTRPSTPPAPATNFAALPAVATKPAESSKATPRPDLSRPAPARPGGAPLSLAPPLPGQAQQSPPPNQAQAPASSPQPSTARRTAEVLTAAAIAALIVKASRDAYYSTGHPCACPDDRMRNGRACGGRSAYSRPGGASPLCYSTDVTEAMIKSYRSRVAER
jgi:hypothetical protein